MQTSEYFEESVRLRRPYLQDAWLIEAWQRPIHQELQANGRVSHFI